MDTEASGRPPEQVRYQIRVQGRLDPRWSTWLDGLELTNDADGTTLLHGRVKDQAALHGVLARLRDLGLTLVSVARLTPDRAETTHHDTSIGD